MPEALQPYAKAVIAAIGIVGLIALSKYDVKYPDLEALIMAVVRESVWGFIATFGVYQVSNRVKK